MKLTGTNRPRTCHIPFRKRLHAAFEHASTVRFPRYGPRPLGRGTKYLHRVSATIARGKRPVPSRTRKLSLSAPMVLRGPLRGRVGRRRTFFGQGPPTGRPLFRLRLDPSQEKRSMDNSSGRDNRGGADRRSGRRDQGTGRGSGRTGAPRGDSP